MQCTAPPASSLNKETAAGALQGLSISANGADFSEVSTLVIHIPHPIYLITILRTSITQPVRFSWSNMWIFDGQVGPSPSSGPMRGGTVVTITGSGFNLRGDLRCRFGGVEEEEEGASSSSSSSPSVVYATVISSTAVQCTAPPSSLISSSAAAAAVVGLYLSFDGGDFIDTGFTFTYYTEPRITHIRPNVIPEDAGR